MRKLKYILSAGLFYLAGCQPDESPALFSARSETHPSESRPLNYAESRKNEIPFYGPGSELLERPVPTFVPKQGDSYGAPQEIKDGPYKGLFYTIIPECNERTILISGKEGSLLKVRTSPILAARDTILAQRKIDYHSAAVRKLAGYGQ